MISIFRTSPLIRLSLIGAVFVSASALPSNAEEGWVYFGNYPNVWSHNEQQWIFFENTTQPTYRYSDGAIPVLFDSLSLDIVDDSMSHFALMRTGDFWMVVRFRADGGAAFLYDMDDNEPIMEGTSNYSINDRTNNILVSIAIQDPETEVQIFFAFDLKFVWADGGWFSLASVHSGQGEAPSPISGFLGTTTGAFWFYPNTDEEEIAIDLIQSTAVE